jgi:HlyD family secretion protein
MKRSTWIVAATLVVAVGAVALLRGRGPRPELVDVTPAARQPSFRSFVTASGEIVATSFADIGSSVMGRIVDLTVREGQRVRAGDVLVRIDPVQARSDVTAAREQIGALESDERAVRQQVLAAQSDLAAARARADEAKRTLVRAQELQAQGLAPAAERDAARATSDTTLAQVAAAEAAVERATQSLAASARRVAQARAQATRAQDLLSKTEILAPIDGIISRLNVRQGEMVVIGVQNQPGTILMTLSNLDAINAEVKVAEADVLGIKEGQAATVTLDALPGRTFTGKVVEVGASALPTTGAGAAAREFRVVVRLDNPDPGLRPGLTCDAEVLVDERANVLTVPLQSVVVRPGENAAEQSGVFEVKGDRVAFVPVRTGIIGGLDIEVTGVAEGAQVISGPFQVLKTLQDGSLVRVNAPPAP